MKCGNAIILGTVSTSAKSAYMTISLTDPFTGCISWTSTDCHRSPC
jgi:hypothetical protein